MDKPADIDVDIAPRAANGRPRNAATLILFDLEHSEPRILMGRRSESLAFMPGMFVFPGGRTDRADHHAPRIGALPASDEARLVAGMGAKGNRRRAEAIALSSIRETREETGLLVGSPLDEHAPTTGIWAEFAAAGIAPDLSALRYVARAITPPGRIRRFDTRFFAAPVSAAANPGDFIAEPRDEFDEVRWVSLSEAGQLPLATITTAVLDDFAKRLERDPALSEDRPVPCHRVRHNRYRLSFE